MLAKLLQRQKLLVKVDVLRSIIFIFTRVKLFTSHLLKLLLSSLMSVSYQLSDADKKPADNLTKLAALDIDNLFAKTQGISKGVLFNVQQSLLKDWGPDSLGVLPEDIMQELLTGVTFVHFLSLLLLLFTSLLYLVLSIALIIYFLSVFFYFVRTYCSSQTESS